MIYLDQTPCLLCSKLEMNAETVTVICCDYNGIFFDSDYVFRSDFQFQMEKNKFRFTVIDSGYSVELDVAQTNVKIILTRGNQSRGKNCEVCLLGNLIHQDDFVDRVKLYAAECKKQYPTAALLLVGDVAYKNFPESVKEAELAGWKIINQATGNTLAREVGAIKYIEYTLISGRGFKNVFYEIAFAGIGNSKENQVQREKEKCNIS